MALLAVLLAATTVRVLGTVVPEVCFAPALVAIRPQTTCSDLGVPYTTHGSLAAQRGEVEAIQVLLRKDPDLGAENGGLQGVFANISGLPSFIACEVFQVGYVNTQHTTRYEGSGGGWRPDPLIPLRRPFNVPPSSSQALWISCEVAAAATPGKYNASMNVTCDGCTKLQQHFNVEVWDITVPPLEESHIGTAWSGTWKPAAFTPYYGPGYWRNSSHDWYSLMLKHRTPPDSIYAGVPRPIAEYEWLAAQGMRWFALMDVTRLPAQAPGPLGAYAAEEPPVRRPLEGLQGGESASHYSDDYVQRLIKALQPTVNALRERGLIDRAFVYGFDENPRSAEPQVRRLFGAIKVAFPDLRTVATLNWSPMPPDLPVDTWVLQYETFNATDAKQWIAAGKEQWHYHCIEPSSLRNLNSFIERNPIQPRLLFWLAALNQLRFGAPSGWLYYSTNKWTECNSSKCGGAHKPKVMERINKTAFTDFPPANFIWRGRLDHIFANGDGQFVYPCPDGPCSTTRLDVIRDGLEDWELFVKLGPEAVPLLLKLVRGPSDWTNDAALVETVRRTAALQLLAKQHAQLAGSLLLP